MTVLELKDKKTLSEKVYDQLKELIISGELKHGEKITESYVSSLFGISNTPVREAFKKLSVDGLIEITSWKGVIVKGITKDDLLDVYECRAVLESLAARRACKNITENDIQILEAIIEKCINVKEEKLLVNLNTEFHNEILRISGNKRLKKLLDDLMLIVLCDREISNRYSIRRHEILEEHIEILNSLKERNSKKITKLMKQHIKNGYNFIKKIR